MNEDLKLLLTGVDVHCSQFGGFAENALKEAYQLGLNAGLANKLTEGTFPELKPEPEGHDFAWALEQMRQGKRISRKSRPVLCLYLSMPDLHIKLGRSDFSATDWEVA